MRCVEAVCRICMSTCSLHSRAHHHLFTQVDKVIIWNRNDKKIPPGTSKLASKLMSDDVTSEFAARLFPLWITLHDTAPTNELGDRSLRRTLSNAVESIRLTFEEFGCVYIDSWFHASMATRVITITVTTTSDIMRGA